jgi:hypothetical protein
MPGDALSTLRVQKLPQAILAKAFRGELVPTEAELARAEGRDYETAEALLRRIRDEQPEPAARPARGRKAEPGGSPSKGRRGKGGTS